MAFALVAATASESIDTGDELLFEIAGILDLSLPSLRTLETKFYDSPTFSAAAASTLADELTMLAASLAAAPHTARLAWDARPPAFRSAVMPQPPDVAALVAKLEALARTCRDAAAHGGPLTCLSD